MQYSQLVEKALAQYNEKLPFVLYSLPDSSEITGIFQSNADRTIAELSQENGFVLAPFDSKKQKLQIPMKGSEILTCIDLPPVLETKKAVTISERVADKEKHLTVTSKAITKIKSGRAQKIVVSRKKEVRLKKFDLRKLCDSLFSQNPSAFRYIWFHPVTSLWCGATPEVLIKTNGSAFSTMALAGTQKLQGKSIIFWDKKERNEQQWVVDAIVDTLLDKTTALNISKANTHIAGDLAHLRTDIKGGLNTSKHALQKIVETLHPTPAVCGTPRTKAQAFILEHENYDREFYTGFLGITNSEVNKTELFVNLRCIKIEEDTATLYAGGGITEDSNPEAEWEETHNKLQTMAKVLQPLL